MLIDPNHYLITAEYIILIALSLSTTFQIRKSKIELFKARAFLNKDFLLFNFILILIAGSLLIVHEFTEMAVEIGNLHHSYHIYSEGLENLSFIFLIIWMYSWWRLGRTKNPTL